MKIYQHCHLTDGSLWDLMLRWEQKMKKKFFLILIPRTVHRTCIHLFDKGCNENGSMVECQRTPIIVISPHDCENPHGCNFSPFHGHCKQSAVCLQVSGLKLPVTHSMYSVLPSPRRYLKPLTPHKFHHTSSFLRVNWVETPSAVCFFPQSQ